MVNFDGSEISLWMDCGLSLSTRTLYMGSITAFNGEESGIDYYVAARLIKQLHVLNQTGNEPITIFLNNPGGDEYHGLAIYEAIRSSKAPVYIKVYGQAMSMASIILQSATERSMSRFSMLMLHYGTFSMQTDSKDVKSNAKENDRYNRWMEDMYLTRIKEKKPRYTIEQVRKLLQTDNYITAPQALKLGLIDQVF